VESSSNQPSSPDFSVGSVVFDKFEIVSFIAEGGMGAVYRARDVARDSIIALKIMRNDALNPKSLMRFQSEAKTASKLNHPNIAKVFDFGYSGQTAYLSMEFVEGETLQSMLDRIEVMELPLFLEIFDQVCTGLLHAHRSGIVHRDLKPGNIAIAFTENGELTAKILDFGIAKSIDSEQSDLTMTGAIIGSPLYMSPEQASALQVTPSSDVYSLGCVMWECLYGEPPFVGETALQTITQHQTGVLPEMVSADLPARLVDRVRMMLNKDPETRADLEFDILPLLRKLKISIGESRVAIAGEEKYDTKGDTNTLKWVAAAIVILLIAVPVVYFATQRVSEPPKEAKTELYESKTFDLDVDTDKNAAPDDRFYKLMQSGPGLEVMGVHGFKNEMLKTFVGNPDIVQLSLGETEVTDKCFPYLAKIPNLLKLELQNTDVVTLEGINKLKNLHVLVLKSTEVSDDAVKNLAGLSKLEHLSLSNTRDLSDQALVNLPVLPKLNTIELVKTQITGATLPELIKQKSLVILRISDCSLLKEPGVRELCKKSNSIAQIELHDCKLISEPEIDALFNDFPHVSFKPRPSKLESLTKKGASLEQKRKPEEARKCYEECVQILTKHQGAKATALPSYFNAIARTYENQKPENWKMVRVFIDKSRALATELNDRPNLQSSMDLETHIIRATKGFTAGNALADKSHQMAKDLFLTSNPDHIDARARVEGEEAMKYDTHGAQRAARYFEESIALRSKKYGANSPAVADSLVHATYAYLKAGNKRKADEYTKRVSYIVENTNEAKSLGLRRGKAYALAGLANISGVRGDNVKALQYSRRACEIANKSLPHCYLNCLNQKLFLLKAGKCDPEEIAETEQILKELKPITDTTQETLGLE